MKGNKYPLLVIFLIFFLWFIVFTFFPSKELSSFSGSTMGTTYEVKISKNIPKSQIDKIKLNVDSILKSFNQNLSTYISNSEISLINKDETVFKSFPISDDFKYVLDRSLHYHELTKNTFDVTLKPLLEIWGFRGDLPNKIPTIEEINEVMQFVGSEKIRLNGNLLIKGHPKLQFDFGAIAKGYAVDKISNYLSSINYDKHYVEIGGEIKCVGKDWIIQVAYPEFMSNKGYKLIKLKNYSVATSGTYNQFIELEQNEFSHIFNPSLGRPSTNNVLSVTVISKNCIDSDALATSLKVLGEKKGLELINSIDDTECMIITYENGILKENKSSNFSNFIID